jgi:excisionase family DNA binding protein
MDRVPEERQWARTRCIRKAFDIPESTLFQWIREGRLPAAKVGRNIYLRVSDVEALMAAHAVRPRRALPRQEAP